MSDDYSFVVAFVVYLFNMDIYLYISMYIQAEYRRFGVFIFYYVISCTYYIFFIVACCFIRGTANYGFHSLLIIILRSQPTSAISTYPLALL